MADVCILFYHSYLEEEVIEERPGTTPSGHRLLAIAEWSRAIGNGIERMRKVLWWFYGAGLPFAATALQTKWSCIQVGKENICRKKMLFAYHNNNNDSNRSVSLRDLQEEPMVNTCGV